MAKTKNSQYGSFDTNILLRFVYKDVPHQTQAIDAMLAKGGRFEIADAALFEMAFVMEKVYLSSRDDIVDSILSIVRNDQFICNKLLLEKTLPLYRDQQKLSIIDCALLVYARLNKATPLYTFDKELVKGSGGNAREI